MFSFFSYMSTPAIAINDMLTRHADISKQRHSEIYTGYSKAIAQVQFGHVVGQDALAMLGLDP